MIETPARAGPDDRGFGGARARDSVLNVAVTIPLEGSAGIFGPSCELCAELAVEELNDEAGILGREVRVTVVDGSGPPQRVADRIDDLVTAGSIDAVVGWHISAVRRAIAPRIAGRVPYVYTALYEGGERTPGVFLTGETPDQQLLPAMRWLAHELGARRWFIIGNDYIWPRRTAASARGYATLCRGSICGQLFVPLGTADFRDALDRVERCKPDVVLMLLVGEDAVHFNRAFARAGLDSCCMRLSTLMDENMLLATGAASTNGIWATAAYFESLVTPESLEFAARYTDRFTPNAPPLNSMGESCYEGIRLLAALAERARTFDQRRMWTTAEGATYAGPRGEVRVRGGHLDQRIHLARANGLDYDVLATLSDPAA
jgi:urea transport system substrate-binding protein